MNFEIKNRKSPFNDFLNIASSLLNENVLLINENYYRLTSIEFYYFDDYNHPDIYSHKHSMQKTTGQWYFHGSGLDITFGSDDVYGGILVRGIQSLKEKKYINWPLMCVQELFSNLGSVDNKESLRFCIMPHEIHPIENQTIHYARRVGLNQTMDKSEKGMFFNGYYRFFINPKETQKDKGAIAIDFLAQGRSEAEINELFGYKHFK